MSMDLSGYVRKKTTITIGTKEFTFVELTLGDLAAFKANLQEQRQVLNTERRKRLLEDAAQIGGVDTLELLKLTDTTISEEEVEAATETIEGLGFLAYLSLKHHHPNISQEDTLNIVTTGVIDQMTEAMFPEIEEEKDKKKLPRRGKVKSPKSLR